MKGRHLRAGTARYGLAALTLSLTASASLPAQTIEPAPPPPLPQPEDREPLPPTAEEVNLQRYEACFQKMVDAGATDNAFMRECLGLPSGKPPVALPTEHPPMTQKQAEEALRNFAPRAERCYAGLQANVKELNMAVPTGRVVMLITVRPDGSRESVRIQEAKITDVRFLRCLKQAAAALPMPASQGKQPVQIKVGYRFALAKSGKSLAQALPGHPQLIAQGGLSPDQKLAVFQQHYRRLEGCYTQLRRRVPKATGTARPVLLVGPDGKVQQVKLEQLTLKDRRFRACLTKRLQSFRFDQPSHGGVELIEYPTFQFIPRPEGTSGKAGRKPPPRPKKSSSPATK